jgi:hypothetical protein
MASVVLTEAWPIQRHLVAGPGARGGRGRRCLDPWRREHHQPVSRRRPDRRAAAAHRAAHARRRHPAIRRCPAPESRTGGFAGSELGHTLDLSRAVLNRRAVLHTSDTVLPTDPPGAAAGRDRDGIQTHRNKPPNTAGAHAMGQNISRICPSPLPKHQITCPCLSWNPDTLMY